MADRVFSHEAMMREIAARAELHLAQTPTPRTPETAFNSIDDFDAFILRRRLAGLKDSRRFH